MKSVSSSTPRLNLNTDRIAVASKQQQKNVSALNTPQTETFNTGSFKREVPLIPQSDFVEIDGKKYYLNAPRGTYVNIVI